MLKRRARVVAVPLAILMAGCVWVAVASAGSPGPTFPGSYTYSNTIPNSQTMVLKANKTLTFEPEGCTGLWTVTGKSFAYEVHAGSPAGCDEQAAAGQVKTVVVSGVDKVKLTGTGTYLVGTTVKTYTWNATQQ